MLKKNSQKRKVQFHLNGFVFIDMLMFVSRIRSALTFIGDKQLKLGGLRSSPIVLNRKNLSFGLFFRVLKKYFRFFFVNDVFNS